MSQDSDNAWKDVLEGYFRDFLCFFFPDVHDAIDWSHRPAFLKQEFLPPEPQALQGKALVDVLARIKLRDGEETIVHLQVEVQGYPDQGFPERLLRYNFLARERLGREVVSLGVLTDDRSSFRPKAYDYARWGFHLRMDFPTVKLLDYRGKERELRESSNPFSVVVLAHLLRIDSPGVKDLYRSKLRLIRLLYQRGYDRKRVRDFLRFLDWILRLPEPLEDRIMKVTLSLEGKNHMPFLSNIERRGLQRGHEKGLEEGKQIGQQIGQQIGEQLGERRGLLEAIALGLELRFGAQALELLPRVREVQEVERLRGLIAELKQTESLEAFREALGKP